MAAKDSSHNRGSSRIRSPYTRAVVLISIYVTTYLAGVGIIHILTAPDAIAAIAPGSSMARPEAATAWTYPAGVHASPRVHSLGRAQ